MTDGLAFDWVVLESNLVSFQIGSRRKEAGVWSKLISLLSRAQVRGLLVSSFIPRSCSNAEES